MCFMSELKFENDKRKKENLAMGREESQSKRKYVVNKEKRGKKGNNRMEIIGREKKVQRKSDIEKKDKRKKGQKWGEKNGYK